MLVFQADEFFEQHKNEIINILRENSNVKYRLAKLKDEIYRVDKDKYNNPCIYFRCDGMREYQIIIKNIESINLEIEKHILRRLR